MKVIAAIVACALIFSVARGECGGFYYSDEECGAESGKIPADGSCHQATVLDDVKYVMCEKSKWC